MENETDISSYEILTKFREPLIYRIIKSLNIPQGSKGLDAGCGIGSITKQLSEEIGENGYVTGLDLSKDFVSYAKNKYKTKNVEFEEGNINALPFNDNSFDWVWSADTVWPGPKELGCPSEDPLPIIKEYHRVIKPGGSIFLLFWSSQKLLPGYPILEAVLNNTSSATAPFTKTMNPNNHVLNASSWLEQSGFKNINVKTYLEDIAAPLSENDKKALKFLFQMFWGGAEAEIGKNDWKTFERIRDPSSSDYILNNKYYYGFYTYTLFNGMK
ncbi:MAG: class I SAM-dependent methyltransferase [Promethearchaeota archaeon]